MISVIIPTRNRARSLARTLQALKAQDFPEDRFEVLVCDNGSTDGTRAVARRFISARPRRRVRYLFEPVPGQLSARHCGALAAAGGVLSFIDDDVDPVPGWLGAIEKAFADPRTRLVGGPSLPVFAAKPPAWLAWFWEEKPGGRLCAHLSLLDFGDKPRPMDPNHVWGLNLSIRRKTLFDLGGFHPDYIPKRLQRFQGDGDTGLTMKAKRRGLKAVYSPGAKVFHRVPRERLTVRYFESRHFYQGVGDSYTALRASHGRLDDPGLSPADLLARRFARLEGPVGPRRPAAPGRSAAPGGSVACGRRDVDTLRGDLKEKLQRRFNRAYARGYLFHQAAVRESPSLLEWVLRKDYWDYGLPC